VGEVGITHLPAVPSFLSRATPKSSFIGTCAPVHECTSDADAAPRARARAHTHTRTHTHANTHARTRTHACARMRTRTQGSGEGTGAGAWHGMAFVVLPSACRGDRPRVPRANTCARPPMRRTPHSVRRTRCNGQRTPSTRARTRPCRGGAEPSEAAAAYLENARGYSRALNERCRAERAAEPKCTGKAFRAFMGTQWRRGQSPIKHASSQRAMAVP
jgi:hypothetical protein